MRQGVALAFMLKRKRPADWRALFDFASRITPEREVLYCTDVRTSSLDAHSVQPAFEVFERATPQAV